MKRLVILVVIVVAAASLALAQTQKGQKGNLEQAIRQLDSERIQALVRSDTAALDRIYSDDFVGIGIMGRVRTKAQLMSDLKSGDLKFNSAKPDDVQVRVYGATAVETGRATVDGRDRGQALPRDTRFTRVWVRQQGRWRLVAAHSSSAAKQ